jgi:hypothetical protein
MELASIPSVVFAGGDVGGSSLGHFEGDGESTSIVAAADVDVTAAQQAGAAETDGTGWLCHARFLGVNVLPFPGEYWTRRNLFFFFFLQSGKRMSVERKKEAPKTCEGFSICGCGR